MTAEQLVRFQEEGVEISFSVRNSLDSVQSNHFNGIFYEKAELEMIRLWFPQGGVFFDVGTNVGNHAIYAAKIMKAKKVICVEPNPVAIEIFRRNRELNGITEQNMPLFCTALSKETATGVVKPGCSDNLGGAKVLPLEMADTNEGRTVVEIATGDDVLADTPVDFIKIDVEGLAMEVLAGLEVTISKYRPTFFIELDDKDQQLFTEWLKETGYHVVGSLIRYETQTNYLVVPESVKQPPSHQSTGDGNQQG